METTIEFSSENVSTLVIENKKYFCKLLQDMYSQIIGEPGNTVLSEDDIPINFSRNVELIDGFIAFDINKKPLINKINTAMEQMAVGSTYYQQSIELLSSIENYINNLCIDLPGSIEASKISVPSLIKMAGMHINNDYPSIPEKLVDYMELVREYDKDKLFIFVNMRSYFCDSIINTFLSTIIDHGFTVLLIDSHSESVLPFEKRLTVDEDLCEF